MMTEYIPRTLEKTIQKAMKTFPAILVTGPRQSGKTTLLKELFSATHRYVSLENPDLRARLLADPIAFVSNNPPPVVLDEVQYVPEFLHYVKSAIDENRVPGNWILSGSQNFNLMESITQSLAGRCAVLSLLPFSIREFVFQSEIDKTVDEALLELFSRSWTQEQITPQTPLSLTEFLLRGSYPEIRANPEVDRQLWCASYIQTYLERDIRQIINLGDLNTFSRFLRLCAARTGQILNQSDLARDIGVSVPTIKSWLSVLEASHQVFLLPPYFNNFGKRLIKRPKLYFMDTGLASFLLGIHDPQALANGPMMGPLFETLIVTNWVKTFRHSGEPSALYYWRSQGGIEIDMLIERDSQLYPFEIKSTQTVLPGHFSVLNKWKNIAGNPGLRGVLIAGADKQESFLGNNVVPWFHTP